jgi:hypothetical protein
VGFNSEGLIVTMTAGARFVNLVRAAGEFIQRLPKVTVTRTDPFLYVPSLWIQADQKGSREADFYNGLNVEEHKDKFFERAALPGDPPQGVSCTELGIAALASLLTQDPAVYFEIETDDQRVEVEVGAAFQNGRCIFLAGYDVTENQWFWLQENEYKTAEAPSHPVGEGDSPIHDALKFIDDDFRILRNPFSGFVPRAPFEPLRRLAAIPDWIDVRLPERVWEWADLFPILSLGSQ